MGPLGLSGTTQMTKFVRTSKFLQLGQVYTRDDLRTAFHIRDATLNNGVFRPNGHASVWLFVTEEKAPDRRPYRDKLDGDELSMDGQTLGRTDELIETHRSADLELLLFYRKKKTEFPKAAFRYEGIFRYVSSEGKNPTRFTLKRISVNAG
jgi:putative restriction endonuclease